MAVTIHVNGTSNSLVHKGSIGIAKSTIPDVCKTPTPGGPVPIPYPIIVSMSSDLKKGTKTVKVDGKKMAAIKGSEFSRCTGDEPGTVGGVKSSTNMKEATWVLYSFDVKLDGKNACRLSDKMMMNHGNTACLNGVVNPPVLAAMMYPEEVDNTECSDGGSHNYVFKPARGKKRISQKIAEAASSFRKGIRFEAKAATHNKKSGDLTNSSQLSGDPHNEKIFLECTFCGHSREIDQTHEGATPGAPPKIVEVKCKAQLSVKDAKQLGRNLQTVARGNASGLIYKVPAGGGGNFLASQIQQLGKIAGQVIKIIKI